MVENSFNVVDFRFAKSTDIYELKYEAWSRIYEYSYILNFIKSKLIAGEVPKLHNSSWGYEGVHVIFRDDLDKIADCIHSDKVHSNYRDTYFYDITTKNMKFNNKFDFVLNVSTIEHLNSQKEILESIENLFEQVKINGYLILTFDYPRVNLSDIENIVNVKCAEIKNRLNGNNSQIKNETYKDLNIVYLILQKNE